MIGKEDVGVVVGGDVGNVILLLDGLHCDLVLIL